MAARERDAAQAPGGAQRARSRPLRDAPPVRAGRRRRAGADLAAAPAGLAARRHRALPALRLRRLWPHDPRRVQHQPAVAGRPRLRLSPSPISAAAPTRAGAGIARASSRTRPTRSPISSPPPSICARSGYTRAGRIVAQGGSAGGMLMGAVANMRARAVRRHHRRSAVRRRAQHHARRHAAADPAGMARMGQPDRRRGRVSHDPQLFALRQCRGAGLSGDAGARRPAPIRASPIGSRPNGWRGCARLKTDGSLLAFRTNMDAGHGGASGRFDRLKEVALAYAFAIKVTGGTLEA